MLKIWVAVHIPFACELCRSQFQQEDQQLALRLGCRSLIHDLHTVPQKILIWLETLPHSMKCFSYEHPNQTPPKKTPTSIPPIHTHPQENPDTNANASPGESHRWWFAPPLCGSPPSPRPLRCDLDVGTDRWKTVWSGTGGFLLARLAPIVGSCGIPGHPLGMYKSP